MENCVKAILYTYPKLKALEEDYGQHIENKAVLSHRYHGDPCELAEYIAGEILKKQRLAWLKSQLDSLFDKLSEEEYLSYAQGFEKEIYNKYHNDEFEWFDQFQIIKQKCDKKIEEADLTATYTVVTTVEFGDYDFTNGGFPISIGEGTFFPLGITSSYYYCDYYF